MPDALSPLPERVMGTDWPGDAYPLTGTGIVFGAVAGGAVAVLFDSLLAGLAIVVLAVGIAVTWRRDEAPIFPFIVAFQWTSIVIGRIYERLVGPLEDPYGLGNTDLAVLLSLTGLVILAIGVRIGSGSSARASRGAGASVGAGRARFLFWTCVALYAVDYLGGINPKDYGGLDQFVQVALNCRQLFLMALWYEVLSGRGPRRYLIVSFLWVFIPAVGNYFATFKGPALLLLLVAARSWRPWEGVWWRTGAPRIAALVPVGVLVVLLAVVWQNGVKRETRRAYDRAEMSGGVRDRVGFFVDRAFETFPAVWNQPHRAFDGLVGRLSYVTFFSRVLDHVPRVEPHAGGELLRMAFLNAFVPRVLYPDKPALPSDSYYTRRFAAAKVAEGATSISIGYMAEFYADWGLTGMFLSIFGYGLWMGAIRRGLTAVVRPTLLLDGALATVFLQVAEFEHQFIKGFAAINVSFVVIVVLMLAARRWLSRVLMRETGGDRGSVLGAPVDQVSY